VSTPSLPQGAPKLSEDGRRTFGASFRRSGEGYHAVRPGYPAWVTDFFLQGLPGPASPAGATLPDADVPGTDSPVAELPGSEVPDAAGARPARAAADLGAGTGLFTRELLSRGLEVSAVEPAAAMRAVLQRELEGVTVLDGTGEATGLPGASQDLVTVAQAWHWMDVEQASAEIVRILRPGGVLGLVWNQLDVTVPWVHRLARIMHSGDVHRDPEQAASVGSGFTDQEIRVNGWEQPVTPEIITELAHSRSYWLGSSQAIRDRVDTNLTWYLHEHLGHAPGEAIALPYVTLAVRYRRS